MWAKLLLVSLRRHKATAAREFVLGAEERGVVGDEHQLSLYIVLPHQR